MVFDRNRRRALGLVAILTVAAGSIAGSTRLDEPPRFDGAGYATLGLALATGRGYVEISHPDAPPHSHFPPGYPASLGLLWKLRGAHRSPRPISCRSVAPCWQYGPPIVGGSRPSPGPWPG